MLRYRPTHAILIILLPVAFSLVSGCAHNPRIYNLEGYQRPSSARIALLPLENLSGAEGAGQRVTDLVLVELLKLGRYDVVEPGEVESALLEYRIRSTNRLSLAEADSIGQKLNCQYLFLGSVLEYDLVQIGATQIPVVALAARILEAKTGRIIWASYHSRRGNDSETIFGLGRVPTLEQLSRAVVEDVMRTLR